MRGDTARYGGMEGDEGLEMQRDAGRCGEVRACRNKGRPAPTQEETTVKSAHLVRMVEGSSCGAKEWGGAEGQEGGVRMNGVRR